MYHPSSNYIIVYLELRVILTAKLKIVLYEHKQGKKKN